MTTSIDVREAGAGTFVVTVREGRSESVHQVTVGDEDLRRLGGGSVSALELVRHSFEFLLEREPKESILRSFALPVIGRYFPGYEREIRKRVAS